MVDSKENYKFDLGVKGLRPVSCVYNHYLKAVFPKVVLGTFLCLGVKSSTQKLFAIAVRYKTSSIFNLPLC